jgi:hypothetical protein
MFTVYPLLINLPYGIIRQGRPSQALQRIIERWCTCPRSIAVLTQKLICGIRRRDLAGRALSSGVGRSLWVILP